MQSDLHIRVFISQAKIEAGSIEAASIYLDGSRRNLETGVTSYLHRENGTFLLYAEGSGTALERLTTGLRRDWRHGEMEIRYQGGAAERMFPGSAMATTDERMISFAGWAGTEGRHPDMWRARVCDLMQFIRVAASRLDELRHDHPKLFPRSETQPCGASAKTPCAAETPAAGPETGRHPSGSALSYTR